MVSKVVVVVGILVFVVLGLMFVSDMTGNVITGSVANEEIVENEYFRIDDFGDGLNEEDLNESQNSSGSG